MDWPAPVKLSPERASAIQAIIKAGVHVYRGVRETGRPSDAGDLGKGTYYSTSKAVAKCYGKLTESKLVLNNPLVLSNEEAYELIAEAYMTCRGNFRDVGAATATRVLKCLGFDGVASVHVEREKEIEIVVFP